MAQDVPITQHHLATLVKPVVSSLMLILAVYFFPLLGKQWGAGAYGGSLHRGEGFSPSKEKKTAVISALNPKYLHQIVTQEKVYTGRVKSVIYFVKACFDRQYNDIEV